MEVFNETKSDLNCYTETHNTTIPEAVKTSVAGDHK